VSNSSANSTDHAAEPVHGAPALVNEAVHGAVTNVASPSQNASSAPEAHQEAAAAAPAAPASTAAPVAATTKKNAAGRSKVLELLFVLPLFVAIIIR